VNKFLDGCHRYGWIINIITSILMLAYFVGGLNTRVDDLKERVIRIENVLLEHKR
jgi:hypothetical protein